jgi:hypothetical protein
MTQDNSAENHKGRPKGSRTRSSRADSRGDNLSKIVDGVMALAQNGERWAAEAVLDRMWPKPKGRTVKGLQLPVGMGIDSIAASFDKIFRAVNDQLISAAEALDYVALLEKQAAVLEQRDITKRLDALEKGMPDAA